jgi:gliding motility-associated-like protein
MKKGNKSLVFLLGIWLSWLFPLGLSAQTGTTEGREFYLGFLINGSSNNNNNISIHLSTKNAADVTVSIPGAGFSFPITLAANESRSLTIPNIYKPSAVGEKEPFAIRVVASDDISVYAYNELSDSGDATMVLPKQSLGDEYLIHSYNNDFFQQSLTQNQVLLVGVQDTTIYEFIPSADLQLIDGSVIYEAGVTVQDTLFLGEQIAYHATNNLSGSTVRTINNNPDGGCVPIAVFVGHVATQVDVCLSSDHLFSQLYAASDWGNDYLVVPFATRFGGDVIQIIARENNTSIAIEPNTVVTLDRGERHTFLAPVVTSINSDRPISVMQLSRGKRCDEAERGDDKADPFMLILSPVDQVINEITFPVFRSEVIDRFFINMVIPAQNISVRLDGVDISGEFQVSAQHPAYAYLTKAINLGTHTLQSTEGVVAHVYGFGESESFGFALGGNLGDFDVEIRDKQLGVLPGNFINVCEDAELTLSVSSQISELQSTYTNIDWVMSNGVILNGQQVNYQFDSAGVYTLDMIASKESSQCSRLIETRTINVIENALDEIIGPASVCPNAQDISYQVGGAAPGYTYNWLISGGTFDGGSTGTSVTVDWSIANANASLSVYSVSPQGCVSDTVDFDIVLNEVLAPSAPRGPEMLCTDDVTGKIYSTPPAAGSSYNWEAVGGAIVSGQGTSTVVVDWSGPGNHILRFFETTTVNSLCSGVSADLQVKVFEPISAVPTTISASCFSNADGSAWLSITGGLSPYDIEWENRQQGDTLFNQSAGTYTASVTDALGCRAEFSVQIGEPSLLTAAAISQDAICNGQRGSARIQVSGGTAPYSFNWTDSQTFTGANRELLDKGSYAVTVVDANGCRTRVNFDIEEPSELEGSFEVRPACPETADGILTVAVNGGTAPYTYIWEVDSTRNNRQIDGLAEGHYALRVIDAAGCELNLNAQVENVSPLLSFPNAFTPNGDNVNDDFGIVYNCALSTNLTIYNQWGELMFSSIDIDERWDGTFKGRPVAAGTYTYFLRYQTIFNGSVLNKVLNGKVKLIR